jgi:hypothetical protein
VWTRISSTRPAMGAPAGIVNVASARKYGRPVALVPVTDVRFCCDTGGGESQRSLSSF